MNGSNVIFATVNEEVVYNFTVTDHNNFTVSLEGILPPQADFTLTRDDDLFLFTWTPTTNAIVSLSFVANDSTGLSNQLHPLVRLCACSLDKGATCDPSDSDGGENRFLLEDCTCGSGWRGQFCNIDINGCLSSNCPEGTNCTDKRAPETGFECGPCPDGYEVSGDKCQGGSTAVMIAFLVTVCCCLFAFL